MTCWWSTVVFISSIHPIDIVMHLMISVARLNPIDTKPRTACAGSEFHNHEVQVMYVKVTHNLVKTKWMKVNHIQSDKIMPRNVWRLTNTDITPEVAQRGTASAAVYFR